MGQKVLKVIKGNNLSRRGIGSVIRPPKFNI